MVNFQMRQKPEVSTMSNGIDINRIARAMSVEHYRPSKRARLTGVMVLIGRALFVAAVVVIVAQER